MAPLQQQQQQQQKVGVLHCLPREIDIRKAYEAKHEHVLQQIFLQILEYVVAVSSSATDEEGDNTNSSSSTAVEAATTLIVDVLKIEQQQSEQHQQEEGQGQSSHYYMVCDCLVDAIWLQTSLLEHHHPNEAIIPLSLVNVLKAITTEAFVPTTSATTTSSTSTAANATENESTAASNNNEQLLVSSAEKQRIYLYNRLLEACDGALLQSCGFLLSTTSGGGGGGVAELQKKMRLTNTTINYRQYKFNVLAEESEGYSKLLYYLLLASSTSSTATTTTTSSTKYVMDELIRIYSLDPNRCFDLCIDVLECELLLLVQKQQQPEQQQQQQQGQRIQFVMDCIIQSCSMIITTQKVAQLLGFKLKGRLEQPKESSKNDSSNNSSKPLTLERTVDSLLHCMVFLCTYNQQQQQPEQNQPVLNVSEMLHYFPDNDLNTYVQLVDTTYQKVTQLEKERITSVGRVRLSGGAGGGENENSDTTTIAASDTVTTILQPLQEQLIIRWVHTFLLDDDKDKCNKISTGHTGSSGWYFVRNVPILEQQWSKLCYLFPATIGVAICDSVQQKVMQSPIFRNIIILNDIGMEEGEEVDKDNDYDSMEVEMESNNDDVTIDDVIDTISQPLMYTWESGCIVLRPILYSQVCRLLSRLLKMNRTSSNDDDPTRIQPTRGLIGFVRNYLLPSLSLFLSNAALSMEIWKVLKQLPYRIRYSLYTSWRGDGLERAALKTKKPLWLIEGELQIGKDARYSLKRLSKDTIRDMSRAVAKCCHSNPLVVFTTILNQIESYDNLVQVMVDSCRFVTPLSLDVLGFCILQRLIGTFNNGGTTNRSRLKESGVNVSQWLQSLESFTGAFYKRFPYVEFQGILCYLVQRIKDGHVMELGVLRTLLKTSGGWSFADYAPAASLTGSQLEGRAGSTLLERETMFFGIVEDVSRHASNELRRVLQSDDIGVSILILLAQVKHKIVFETKSTGRPMPVKLIGNLFDTCQVVMTILLDFLTNSIQDDVEEVQPTSEIVRYAESLPPLAELLDVYKLDVATAWMLCGPLIRAASSLPDSVSNSDNKAQSGLGSRPLTAFMPSEESRKVYAKILPATTWTHISVDLFEIFYSATLYDMFCPEDIYYAEIARLEKDIDRLARHKTTSQQVSLQPGAAPERSDKEETERMKKVAARLGVDLIRQKKHVKLFHQRLEAKTNSFFPSLQVSAESAMVFLHRFIYPRCLQGPDEALFCARFVQFLHENDTPGFGTLHFFDALLTILSRSLFCLTEGEAACASILLSETWKVVSKWRYHDDAFERELAGRSGSVMAVMNDNDEIQATPVNREDYRNLYNKWHAAIGAACLGCLRSTEYMHLRNCLVVLTRMVECYPTRPRLANQLLNALEPLQDESNSLADIRASAQAYSMQLVKARDEGVWKEEDVATVKARLEKEQDAARQRHRKAEEQMAEIKRDQEKITEEIGDSRDRERPRLRPGPIYESSAQDRRGDDSRRRTDDRRPPSLYRTGGSSSYSAIASAAGGGVQREEANRGGLEGRWQRAGEREPITGRGSKRSRPTSPAEQGEDRDEQIPASKRPRASQETSDDGGRTDDRRRMGPRRRQIGRR